MRSSVLARSRMLPGVRSLALAAVVAAGLAGCTAANNSSVTVSGKNLTIYLSAPSAGGQAAQDVFDAEQLAFQRNNGEVTGFSLSLKTLAAAKLSDRARTAIEDTKAVAYLGEIQPGDSADSIGITNAQDLLQVSPTDTALELTEATSAVPGAPNHYYESLSSYGRTFARVVPNTAQEAKAQLQEMHALGVTKLYVTNDGSDYGRAVAQAVRAGASPAITTVASPSAADGVFYGGQSAAAAARTFQSVAQSNAAVKLFAPSALAGDALPAALGGANLKLYVSVPGFQASGLNDAAKAFAAAFKSTYGHAPSTQALFGYEAMSAVLDVLKEAGSSANNRATVVKDFFAIKNRSSVLGTYSINANGDTNIAPFVFDRLTSGKLVPFTSVQAQG